MDQSQIQEFIKPELLILVPVLYFIGLGLKQSQVLDKYIPSVLGIVGVILACLYVCGSDGITMISIFTAITQGALCSGFSVYVNQLIKQNNKNI